MKYKNRTFYVHRAVYDFVITDKKKNRCKDSALFILEYLIQV